jgi:RNase P subunit RPR2
MAKIIDLKENKIVICNHCHSFVQYEREDVECAYDPLVEGAWTIIKCPNCGHEIQVDER